MKILRCMYRSNTNVNIRLKLGSLCSSRIQRPKQEKAEKDTFKQTYEQATLHYHARSIFFSPVSIFF